MAQRDAREKSNIFFAAILGVFVLTTLSAAETQPWQTVFVSGEGGYHTYRIPAIVATSKGTLLAFCEGRRGSQSDSGDIDLLLRRSFDGGVAWEAVQVVVDDGGNTCGNPCPIVDRATGVIVLLLTKNNGSEDESAIVAGKAAPRTVWVTTSRDDGATWSEPIDVSAQTRKPEWRWYATGPGHGIQLRDGRMIAPCDHSTGPEPGDMYSHVIVSDDGGATWQIGGVTDSRMNECSVAELTDDSVYLNARNYRDTHCRAYCISRDRGMTWSAARDDPSLIEPVCQGSVLRLAKADDSLIVFSNPSSTKRENLTIKASRDEAGTWPVAKPIWPGPAAYSDLVELQDGRVGCLFECGEKSPYETIRFAVTKLD